MPNFIINNSPWFSVVALILSVICILSLLSGNLRKKRSAEPQPLGFGMGSLLILVVVGITALAITLLLLKSRNSNSSVDQLINMQGITLAITGAAVALISIISTLQNYDREKKSKEIEDELRSRIDRLEADNKDWRDRLENENKLKWDKLEEENRAQKQLIEKNRTEAKDEFDKLNKTLTDNIRVLFDANSEDDVHLRIRITEYRMILAQNPQNLNVGLALIDALAHRADTDTDRDQKAENDEIIRIVDNLLKDPHEPLEWINLLIKKANACYENGCMSETTGRMKEAEKYITEAQDIYTKLLKSEDVPKDLSAFLEGYLGLCCFWRFRASGKTDEHMLDESIRHYEACVLQHPSDAKMLNSLAVSKQNKARLIKNKDEKINALLAVVEDYKKAIKANPKREKSWLNVASVYSDVIHLMIGIDPREKSFPTRREIQENGKEYYKQIRVLHDDGLDHIEKAMMLNPGLVNLYYVHADLDVCRAIIDDCMNDIMPMLTDAKRRLEYGLILDKENKALQMIINLYNHTVVEFHEEKLRIEA